MSSRLLHREQLVNRIRSDKVSSSSTKTLAHQLVKAERELNNKIKDLDVEQRMMMKKLEKRGLKLTDELSKALPDCFKSPRVRKRSNTITQPFLESNGMKRWGSISDLRSSSLMQEIQHDCINPKLGAQLPGIARRKTSDPEKEGFARTETAVECDVKEKSPELAENKENKDELLPFARNRIKSESELTRMTWKEKQLLQTKANFAQKLPASERPAMKKQVPLSPLHAKVLQVKQEHYAGGRRRSLSEEDIFEVLKAMQREKKFVDVSEERGCSTPSLARRKVLSRTVSSPPQSKTLSLPSLSGHKPDQPRRKTGFVLPVPTGLRSLEEESRHGLWCKFGSDSIRGEEDAESEDEDDWKSLQKCRYLRKPKHYETEDERDYDLSLFKSSQEDEQ